MTYKKIIIPVFILLLLVSTVAATFDTGVIQHYWDFDTDLNDTTVRKEGLTNEGTTVAKGIISNARYFNANTDRLVNNTKVVNVSSITMWVNLTTNSTANPNILVAQRAADGWYFQIDGSGTNYALHVIDDDGASSHCYSAALSWNTSQLYFISVVKNSSSYHYYRDNQLLANGACAGKVTQHFDESGAEFDIGNYAADTSGSGIVIDEVGLYDYVLTPANISELYNSGLGLNPFNPPANFSVTLSNIYTGSPIVNFTAIINGTYYTTTTGTITTTYPKLDENIFNITVIPNVTTTYFNVSYQNYNTSDSLAAETYEAVISFTATETITGNSVTGNFTTVNGQTSISSLFLNSGVIPVNFSNSTWWTTTQWFTIASLENSSKVFTNASQYRLSINATNSTGAITIFNVSIQMVGASYTYWEHFTTTNGIIEAYLTNGTFQLALNSSNYSLQYVNVTLDDTHENYTFNALNENSFNFSFYDSETLNLLDHETITVELISNVFSSNYTTSNGLLEITLLTPADYTIRYSAPSYEESFYYTTLTPKSYNNIELYLANKTLYTNVTATVYDQNNNLVEDARIIVQKYDITTNTYFTQEMAETDFSGVAILNLILDTEFYKFIIQDSNGVTRLTTNPSYITNENINFQIVLGTQVASDYYDTLSIDWSLTFINASHTFSFNYIDSANLISQACLEVFRTTINGLVAYNSTCSTSNTATLLAGVAPINGTHYIAKAYFTIGDNKILVGQYYKSFLATNPTGRIGLFIVWLLVLVFAFTALWSPSLAAVLTPIPLVIGSYLNLTGFGLGVAIPIMVLGLVVAFILGRSG